MSCILRLGSPRAALGIGTKVYSTMVSTTRSTQSHIFPTSNANYKLVRFASTNRLYTEKHEWISLQESDKKIGRVGISNHAQEALGDVVYVQVPEVNTNYKQFDEVGAIESVKAASEITTPVSGSVVKVNESLEQKPSLVNSSCYDDGWLFEIKVDDEKELDNLMDEDKYKKFLETSTSSD